MGFFIGSASVRSLFRVLGDDENALTGALAYCASCSPNFLRELLRRMGLKNLREDDLASANIYYQRHAEDRKEGITDVEVHIPGKLHVIIEAKIGGAFPTLEQCNKYSSRLDKAVPEKSRRLAVLVDSADVGIGAEYRKRHQPLDGGLVPLLWGSVCQDAQSTRGRASNAVEKFVLSELCYFIEREYYMRSFEEEVWVVPLSIKPLEGVPFTMYDIPLKYRSYFHPEKRSRRKAIYFAPRAHGKVEQVQRILAIEHDKHLKEYIQEHIPELSAVPWAAEPYTIFHLGEPIKLPAPVKSGPIRDRLAYCDFDLLVTSQSIDEAQKKTITRRKEEMAKESGSPVSVNPE
ncbi:MAG: hypothetical protein Q8O40_09205 [Chloroflexota bacterium]|nr:hypothetical protein [Chloroflexota bacterium]